MSRRLRGAGRDDRGAVTVLVAVLLSAGLLLGVGALVIDTGQLHAEQSELQGGADAAVLAIAQACAAGCGSQSYSTALHFAQANADDGRTAVTVCGRAAVGVLGVCPPVATPDPCLGSRPATGNFVEVHTSTLRTDGSRALPPVFGRALLGESYSGRGVLACSRAAWGGPQLASGFAFTISLCDWTAATGGGGSYAPPLPAVPPASADRVLLIHGTSSQCAGGPSGWNLPGGFGWLADTTGTCRTTVDVTGSYQDTTGVSASHVCQTALGDARAQRTSVLVPVFDGAGGTGHGGVYHLRGFATFVLTGYSLPGFRAKSTLTNAFPCNGDVKCVSGYFTRGLIPAGAELGGPDLGTVVVRMVG
ncbi:MAG TPA: pilus assembly protein TadG-related protein [Umezawaea sp.]|nr:pilus assembly protein TadG-related protein [Umezawaea sp.]